MTAMRAAAGAAAGAATMATSHRWVLLLRVLLARLKGACSSSHAVFVCSCPSAALLVAAVRAPCDVQLLHIFWLCLQLLHGRARQGLRRGAPPAAALPLHPALSFACLQATSYAIQQPNETLDQPSFDCSTGCVLHAPLQSLMRMLLLLLAAAVAVLLLLLLPCLL